MRRALWVLCAAAGDSFGVHEEMSYLAQLYAEGDATFLANVGNLVKPVTKQEYEGRPKNDVGGGGDFPPYLFSHNWQRRQAKSLEPQHKFAKGVLGRIVDALTAQPSACGPKSKPADAPVSSHEH